MIPTSVSKAGVARWWHGVTFVVVAASLVLQLTGLVVAVVFLALVGLVALVDRSTPSAPIRKQVS